MDARGRSVGSAVLALRLSGRFKDEALNKRFIDTTLTDDVNELAIRLRGLITMLRGSEIGLGYELLFQHLVAWQNPTKRSATRRRWGADYSRVAIDLNGGTESHGKLSTT
jgi:CRISPR system Cascade subunit CasB